MDRGDSRGLLKSILGFFARKRPEKLSQTSLKAQALDAWVRTDAYLQHEATDFDEIEPEQVARTLETFEDLVHYDPDVDLNSDIHQNLPYPKLRRMIQRPSYDTHAGIGSNIRIGKRKRVNDAIIEQLSHLETEAKKRRVVPREELSMVDDITEPEVDSAMLMREYSMSLYQGLRIHWTCVCQNCSSLSIRLSLAGRRRNSQKDTCFEVFFGVRSVLAVILQEAKITVRDRQNVEATSMSTISNALPGLANICQSISESLDQQNCLHLLFEGGLFQRLRPQPKTFDDAQMPRTVSLLALFKRQQDLSGGSSVLPLKGKRILAVILAAALLPFLETPWVQPSFNHSKIQFYQPLQNEKLPDITKPFLDLEQVPIISANKMDSGIGQPENTAHKHRIHPNASVLALGILLCELHYCTPIESWQKDIEAVRNVNTDYYTSLDILKNLEVDAGVDYYLATKACLQWEYFPTGELTSFESASVQKLFYQNVIKRLESEIFKSWHLRLEDLNSFCSRENELCWGLIGREVVRRPSIKPEYPTGSNEDLAVFSSPIARNMSMNSISHSQATILRSAQHTYKRNSIGLQSLQIRPHLAESSTRSLHLYDANHQKPSEQDAKLSERWMDGLLSSIYKHVDLFDNASEQPAKSFDINSKKLEPVRIAILDSGYDQKNSLLMGKDGQLDPRIKRVQNFVPGTEQWDIQDEIGHGTHALGLLLKVAACAEIYIARIANQKTLGRNSYDAITQAINHAVTEWKVDIISMSFGIREYHESMKTAISNASHNQTLMFAAASNDGGNLGRAFPAKYPSVFCIHATDGNGNPSSFNPTADKEDVNFSLLGEHVLSFWPSGKNGHNEMVNVMSGTSVATPIAAGLAASVLAFVRQQEQDLPAGSDLLGPWLKDVHSMNAVLKSMVKRRRAGYDYITPHTLLDLESSKEQVYNKIKEIKKHIYD